MKSKITGLLVGALAPLIGLAMVGATPATAQQGTTGKVAYVNTQEILKATPEYAKAESLYNREFEEHQAEVQKIRERMDSIAGDFERQSAMLNARQREARRKEFEAEGQRAEERFQELRRKIAMRERELLEPIQSRINSVIEGIRAGGGYAIIFDVSSPNSGIVTADRSLDLTQRVIDQLN